MHPRHLYRNLASRQRRPKVDLTAIQGILAKYDFELTENPQWPGGRGRSQSLLVHTSHGKKILKKYNDSIIGPAILYEHSILSYLAKINFPSPRLVATKTGQTWLRWDGDNYVLFDFIENGYQYHNYVLFPAQRQQFIKIAGEMLANLHHTLQDFIPDGYNPNGFKSQKEGRWRDLEWYMSKLTYCVTEISRLDTAGKENQAIEFLGRAKYFEESLIQLDTMLNEATLPRLITHGDYGPYNLLFRENAEVIILDFEISHLDWRTAELAKALWRFCYDGLPSFRIKRMKHFLNAYQEGGQLVSLSELQLIPAVWKFLHIRRWICIWNHYCKTQVKASLAKARRHLELVDWMTTNQDKIVAVLSAR